MSISDMYNGWKIYERIKRKFKEDTLMKAKLSSRKLWATILTTILTLVNAQVNLLTPDQMHWITGLVGTYIAGQSIVDSIQGSSSSGNGSTPKA